MKAVGWFLGGLALVLGGGYFLSLAQTALKLNFSFLKLVSAGYAGGKLYAKIRFRVSNSSANALPLDGFFGDSFAVIQTGPGAGTYKVGDFQLFDASTKDIPAMGAAEVDIRCVFVASDLVYFLKASGLLSTPLKVVDDFTQGKLPLDNLLLKGSAKVDGSVYPITYTIQF
jgi:hypothetical protein